MAGIERPVPFAGDLLAGVLALFGFGAVLLTGFGTHPDWTRQRLLRRGTASPSQLPPTPE